MLVLCLVLGMAFAAPGSLRGDRRLLKDTDGRGGCFEEKNKLNYYARNPWNSDGLEKGDYGQRGDWAKCLPSPAFGIMCTHAQRKGEWKPWNPSPREDQAMELANSTRWRFQMHDLHAGWLYELLLELHEKYCAHVELELSRAAKDAFDAYLMGTGDFAPEPEPEPESEGESEAEGEAEGEAAAEPEPEPESEPESEAEGEAEAEAEAEGKTVSAVLAAMQARFTICTTLDSRSPRSLLRHSLYCAMAELAGYSQSPQPGDRSCDLIFGGDGEGEQHYCPEHGGQSCGVVVDLSTNWPMKQQLSCRDFCGIYSTECVETTVVREGDCTPVRSWTCDKPAQDLRWKESLKCVCRSPAMPFDQEVVAHPVDLEELAEYESCPSYKRVVLHLDVAEHRVAVQHREQFEESRDDMNSIGDYELCEGKELTVPETPGHCSMGSRMHGDVSRPCLVRLEQRTRSGASQACADRGGRLLKLSSLEELEELVAFLGNSAVGMGLFDAGGYDWAFNGEAASQEAADLVEQLAATYGDVKRTGCLRLRRHQGKARVEAVSCDGKLDWVCEGLQENGLGAELVTGDLLADEGAFCLWHYQQPADELPNDEGSNFRNTDLACSLQVSSREQQKCGYDPSTDKLYKQYGSRENEQSYPVLGSSVGWPSNDTFLTLEDADDYFHCHFTPMNSGLLRMFEFQHMFERNYPGALRRTCGCGYKHLANLVSRCDCTRSGKGDNNCAQWHRNSLLAATREGPVRCNNCNSKSPI